MPNRFSKAFRRRSSGGSNVFEYEEPATVTGEGTFRVLRRTQTDVPQPLHSASAVSSNAPPYLKHDSRPRSYGDGSDASYKGSGNTQNSSSTANQRHSYASTNPSSVDVHDVPPLPHHASAQKFMNQHPPPPPPPAAAQPDRDQQPAPRSSFSLKNAGRAFSFGTRNSKQNAAAAEAKQQRERALTASSYASTTTAPKLDLGESNIGTSDFGDLFGARNASTIMEEVPPVPPLPPNAQSQYSSENPVADFPPPRRPSSPSGYSWTSNASAEKLMTSPRGQGNNVPGESPHFLSQFGGDSDSQLLLESLYGGGPAGGFNPQQGNSSTAPQPPRHIPDRTIQRPRAPPSAFTGHRSVPSPAGRYPPAASNRYDDGFSSAPLTSTRSPPVHDGDDEPLFDAPRVRRPYRPLGREATMTKRVTRNKVMTPAEFEEAKKRRDLGIKDDEDDASSSSESDAYEDEDETEKTKNIARQRRRQEAQLTVYRQQMMKVTGEQPSDLPDMNLNRPSPLQRSANSAPSMLGAMPWESQDKEGQSQAVTASGGKSGSEDEDEDVPLGVLQAHGFPTKGARPPTRVSSNGLQSASESNLLRNYPTPAGATRNDAAAGGGGNPNLPVFAKNLPQDPYVGANLVNSGRREAMGMNGDVTPPKGVPPGGLVGVIAGEERARALRRGSPNTGGTYDAVPPSQLPMEVQEQMMRQQMMNAGRPTSPEQQAQMQVNNNMMQMMQMQMQWMQQMMQMQGMQMPPMPAMPGMPGMGGSLPGSMPGTPGAMPGMPGSYLGVDPNARPLSQASFGGHQRDASHMSRGPTPSTFNGLGNSSAQSVFGMQGPGPGYATSIAPSERSVAGQPSRYRPVTPSGQAPANQHSRSSTMSANTVQPGLGLRSQRSQSRLRTGSTDDLRKSTMTLGSSTNGERPTIKAVNKPKMGTAHPPDDDDDEAWADMARKRDARKSKWRNKPSEHDSSFASSQEGLEGLYYEG